MSAVTEWIQDIFMVILSVTFMEILLPEGAMTKYLKFIFSMVILAVLLSPVHYFLA